MTGVLLLGITASALAVAQALDARSEDEARRADLAATVLNASLQQAVGSLRGVDVLAADGSVSASELALFAGDVLPGSLFAALAYSEIVEGADRARWEAEHGRSILELVPPGRLVPAAERARYDVVTWVHPDDGAYNAIVGLDVFSEPVRRAASEATLHTSRPVAMGPISVQPSARPGLFLTNVVKDVDGRAIGFVSSGVAVDDLLGQLPEDIDPATVTVAIGDHVLNEPVRTEPAPDEPVRTEAGRGGTSRSFVAGNRFTVTVATGDRPDLLLPGVVVAGTALLAVAALTAALADRRHRVRRSKLLAREAGLAELGRRLAASSSFDAVVDTALAHTAVVVDADDIELAHLDAGDHRHLVVHRAGDRRSVHVHDRSEPTPLSTTIDTGRPVTVHGGAAHEPAMRCVPIAASDGTVWAGLGFIWSSAERAASVEEPATAAAAAAAVVGGALERAITAEALADRAAQLSELAQAIAVAHDIDALTAAIERWLPRLVAATRATLVQAPPPSGRWSLDVTWTAEPAGALTDRMLLGTVNELVEAAIARIQRSQHEHQLIEQLQHALLAEVPHRQALEVAVRYEPALSAVGIGGDWYDVVDLSPTETGVVIGDVTGHGTAAVVVMAELQALTRHLLAGGTPLEEICSQLDRSLQRHGTYATAVVGRLDLAAGTFTYVNAGHPAPILRRGATSGAAAHIVELAGGRRPLLGVGTPLEPAETETVTVAAGDLLLLYTDGLIERREESMADSVSALLARIDAAGHSTADVLGAAFLAGGPGRPDAADDDAAALALRIGTVGVDGNGG
ncbi:MAG: SpoIIE family protein phosphatase [Acidimicrobiia bacterium]